jgi:hypothetical protein
VFSLDSGGHHRNACKILPVKSKVARQQPLRLRRRMSSDQKIRGDSIASPAAPPVVMPGLKFFLDLTTLIDYFSSRR